jgi:hypothetical protein
VWTWRRRAGGVCMKGGSHVGRMPQQL